MNEDFSELRGERRSFFCPNKLWNRLLEETADCISVSSYIKIAIVEKIVRENPDLENELDKLIG